MGLLAELTWICEECNRIHRHVGAYSDSSDLEAMLREPDGWGFRAEYSGLMCPSCHQKQEDGQ